MEWAVSGVILQNFTRALSAPEGAIALFNLFVVTEDDHVGYIVANGTSARQACW